MCASLGVCILCALEQGLWSFLLALHHVQRGPVGLAYSWNREGKAIWLSRCCRGMGEIWQIPAGRGQKIPILNVILIFIPKQSWAFPYIGFVWPFYFPWRFVSSIVFCQLSQFWWNLVFLVYCNKTLFSQISCTAPPSPPNQAHLTQREGTLCVIFFFKDCTLF